MQKKLKTMMVFTAAIAGALVLTSCGEEQFSENEFTYNSYIGSKIGTWNVHDWETSDESYINAFTEMGLYDVVLNSEKNGYEFVTEMASEFPYKVKVGTTDQEGIDPNKDITENDYETLLQTYGYSNITEGLVWDIALNPNAKWEDGTPITSTDYVESMRRQLDPAMINYRADSFYASTLVIANAEKYFKSNRRTIEPLYNYLNADTMEFKDKANAATVGNNYYLNLGVYTPFVSECFSNADSSTFLYHVLDQVGDNYAPEACQRIIDAVQYYLLYRVDHIHDENKDDWEKCKSPSDVTSEMMNYDIPILDFDKSDKSVKVRKTSTSNWTDETQVIDYSRQDLIDDLNAFLRAFKSKTSTNSYRLMLFGLIKNAEFSDFNKVGIVATDDYTIRLYLEKTITLLDLKFALSSNWLVKCDLYDSLKQTTGGMTSTKYATISPEYYMSYGPYKLVSFTEGHSFKVVRNENWYGYTDGNHVGQFQMTGMETIVVENHQTAVGLFEEGKLDDLALDANDMKVYGNSSRLTTTPESYTQKISFNSDRAKLRARQSGNNIKTILANDNFRKGLSLSLNRNSFAATTTAGSKPFTGLLNELYLTDVAIGEMYNSTEAGKGVYDLVYSKLGGDPYSESYDASNPGALARSAQGYNYQQAVYHVEQAIGEELESGDLQSGNVIDIEFRVYDNESETTINMTNFLRSAFQNVLKDAVAKYNENNDTSIALSLKLENVKDEDYYNSAKAGNYDMIFSIWGGAAINPYGLMQVYCDPEFESTCEYGFKGKQDNEYLEIEWDGQEGIDPTTERKTFFAWFSDIVDNIKEPDLEGVLVNDDRNDPANAEIMAEYNSVHNKRVTILAGLEAGILNRFEAIPLVARGTSSLTSFKVENGTSSYINLVGYGGVRAMTFNYNDKTWNEYINSSDYNKDLYKL